MAASIPNLIRIAVTNGDAIAECRKTGNSNTGTYFIASDSDIVLFERFFYSSNKYVFDVKKIISYCEAIKKYLIKDDYPDKLNSLYENEKFFENIKKECYTRVITRDNDTRHFMRFEDNNENVVKSFRGILYGEYSYIVLEEIGEGLISIYADVDYSKIQFTNMQEITDELDESIEEVINSRTIVEDF